MSEYIKREDIRRMMYEEAFEKESELQRWDSGCWIRYKLFERCIDSVPAADVVKHKVSSWLVITCDNVVSSYQCENCWHISEDASNFCPKCGSDMLYLKQNNVYNALERKE